MIRTKCFLDCEFTGLHQNTTLISIGIVSECGKTFYAELNDFDPSQVDKWLQDNVIDSMFLTRLMKIGEDGHFWEGCELHACNMETLKVRLEKWLSQFESIEMWSDCLAYDWMLFCQIFGHAFSIPKHVHYIPFDICTLFKSKGIDPDISREEFGGENIYDGVKLKLNGAPTHNALRDSFLIRSCYNNLQLL